MSRLTAETARELREQGYSMARIAELHGVSRAWVKALLDPREMQRIAATSKAWMHSGVCPDCGGPMLNPKFGEYMHRGPIQRCRACHYTKVRADRLAYQADEDGNLWCSACKTYHEPSAFPPSMQVVDIRKRRCTASDSAARKAYRERRKLPCEQCGKPRLPKGEKSGSWARRHLADSGLCRDCYVASIRVAP